MLCIGRNYAFAEEQPVAPITSETSLTDYAKHLVGRESYGVYLGGKKTGWMIVESRLSEYRGQPVLEESTEFRLVMKFLADPLKMESNSVVRYALEGDGGLVYAEEVEIDGEMKTTRVANRTGDDLMITTTPTAYPTMRRVQAPRDTLSAARDLEIWLAVPPKAHDKTTIYETALGEENVDQTMTAEYLGAEPLVWGGVPITASKILVDMDGGKSEMLVGPNGKLLRGTLGALMEIRAEEEGIAKKLDQEPVDMLAASAIPVAEPLGDGDTIRKLTLEVSGLGDFDFPVSPRQQVSPIADGTIQVTLTRDPDPAAPDALSDAMRAKLLRSTPTVQADDKEIQQLAKEIVGEEQDPIAKARKIVAWIDKNLRATYAANASTATAVLAQRSGDCTEHALLFTALARAAGVPARQLGGVVYTDDPAPLFAWHAWAEIHDGNTWVTVDPMWKQVNVDPTHVQLSIDDGDDAAWINILGAVKIKVVNVERE